MTRYQLYPMIHWRVASASPGRAVFRPSTRTVSRRLMWTVTAGIIMVALYFFIGRPLDRAAMGREPQAVAPSPELQALAAELEDDLRERMSDAEWQAFEEERAAQQRTREADREEFTALRGMPITVARGSYLAIMGVLAATGLFGPISASWQRVVVARNARGELVIARRGLLPQRHRWPGGVFQFIATRAEQQVRRERHGGYQPAGWRWQVALVPREGVETLAEFWVEYESERSPGDTSVPDAVVTFVRTLKHLTGLPAREPVFVAFEGVQRGLFRSNIKFLRRGSAPTVTKSTQATYGSLDEMPEHLRAKAEALMAQATSDAASRGWGHGEYRASSYTVTDAEGRTRTYASLDEMPSETRAMFEQAMRDRSK